MTKEEAAVIVAAREWVARIVSPPDNWADEADLALIESVRALDARA